MLGKALHATSVPFTCPWRKSKRMSEYKRRVTRWTVYESGTKVYLDSYTIFCFVPRLGEKLQITFTFFWKARKQSCQKGQVPTHQQDHKIHQQQLYFYHYSEKIKETQGRRRVKQKKTIK